MSQEQKRNAPRLKIGQPPASGSLSLEEMETTHPVARSPKKEEAADWPELRRRGVTVKRVVSNRESC